jgi:hypothetical protein
VTLKRLLKKNGYHFYSRIPHLLQTLLWRTLSVLYDTNNVIAVFFIGFLLSGIWASLVAAALYTGAVLPIQVAHFATADCMTVIWVEVTLLFSLRA